MLRIFRKYFITGLIVILPVVITFWIIRIVFLFFDGILGKYIRILFEKRHYEAYIPGTGLLLSILIVFLIGFVVHKILGKKFVSWVERWFSNLPGVKHIYSPTKQVVDFLFVKHRASLKKVVLVEYPRKGIYSIGFLSCDHAPTSSKVVGEDIVGILVPSTPNPLTAYFMFVPRSTLIFPEMSVEEALNFIISGGIASNSKSSEEPVA